MTPSDHCAWHPPIIIHDLADAMAAAEAAQSVSAGAEPIGANMRTAPGSAAYLGLNWFHALERHLAQVFARLPRRLVLDCGTETGLAALALRRGTPVRSEEAGALAQRLLSFATASGCWLDEDPRPALDLADRAFPDALCRDWIGSWAAERKLGLIVPSRESDGAQPLAPGI